MTKKQIGILGGSFNPPHLGHLLASIYALTLFELDEIWFLPAFQHAFQKILAPFRNRVDMCRLLIQGLSKKLRVSTIEKTLDNGGKMLLTLTALKQQYPYYQFSLIIGSDVMREKQQWYRFSQIKKQFNVIVVPRGTEKGETLYIPNISSTMVRKHINNSPKIVKLTRPEIISYIKHHGLYK